MSDITKIFSTRQIWDDGYKKGCEDSQEGGAGSMYDYDQKQREFAIRQADEWLADHRISASWRIISMLRDELVRITFKDDA